MLAGWLGCVGFDSYAPLSQLLPLHSTVKVMISRVLLPGPHIMQYRVLVRKMLPLGTSGVCVLQFTLTALSRSYCSSVISMLHLVCLGPTGAESGLVYA